MYNSGNIVMHDPASYWPGGFGSPGFSERSVSPFVSNPDADALAKLHSWNPQNVLRLLDHLPVSVIVVHGPPCRPMFYTALMDQPSWLSWWAADSGSQVDVRIVEADTGAAVWGATSEGLQAHRWALPDLKLKPGRPYEWSVRPSGTIGPGSHKEALASFPIEPTTSSKAQFWLLTSTERDRFVSGLSMLRERSDPEFLSIAEALYLAEFQMYHHALTRLPIHRDGSSAAYSALYATARSVIFRQMVRRLEGAGGGNECFLEWARANERFHWDQAESRLPREDAAHLARSRRAPHRRSRIGRGEPHAKSVNEIRIAS